MYINNCRCCSNKNLKTVIDLGSSPLANNLLNNNYEPDELFPLEMMYCPVCHYCQLSYTVPPEKLFNTYLYISSTTKTFREHFKNAAENYVKKFNLTDKSLVVDIGCNDGIALIPFKEYGINSIGVDPASNIVELAKNNGINVIQSYFNEKTADKIIKDYGLVDLVTASNVFAHSDDIKQITHSVFKMLKQDGVFVIEVQYLYDTINDLTFDNIYHEHVSYWSVTSLNNFFNNLGYSIISVEHVNTHGGSIRVYIKRAEYSADKSVYEFLEKEKQFGLTNYKIYEEFGNKIKKAKDTVRKNFNKFKQQNLKIAGYGAPAKATTSLNYYGINYQYIDYIVEDNKLKHDKIIPGVKIPIFSKTHLKENKVDVIIVMAWNFFDEIKKNNSQIIDENILMLSIKDLQNDLDNYEMYLL